MGNPVPSGRHRPILTGFLLALLLLVTGCGKPRKVETGFTSTSDFHSSFYFSVWEAVEGSQDGYSKYEVNLDRGTITLVESKPFHAVSQIQTPPGAVNVTASQWTLSGVPAPNGKYLASWREPASDGSSVLRITDSLMHVERGKIAIPKGSQIASVAWSADSSYLAALVQTEKTDYGIFGWFFGHGVPKSNFDATVFSTDTRTAVEIPLARSVPFAAAAYLQWPPTTAH